MQQAIKDGADRGDIAEQFSPVFNGTIRCQQGAGAFVTAHDDLQQVLRGRNRQLAHSEVVDDQQLLRTPRSISAIIGSEQGDERTRSRGASTVIRKRIEDEMTVSAFAIQISATRILRQSVDHFSELLSWERPSAASQRQSIFRMARNLGAVRTEPAQFTVRMTALLVTLPTELLTRTANMAPLLAEFVTGVV